MSSMMERKIGRIIAASLIAAMVLSVSSLLYADVIETTKNVAVHVPINSVFGFEIWDTEFDQYLTDMYPGDTATGDIHIYATSNHDQPYTINATCSGLVGENQASPDTIFIDITTFDGGSGLNGTVVSGLRLTASAQAIYTAGTGDYPCTGLEIGCTFSVPSLLTTKQDMYTGTILMTMTE